MSENTSSLWPTQIRASVQSPTAILRVQAAALMKQTNGLLDAEATQKFNSKHELIIINFDIVVPLLNNYRHRIMRAAHAKELPYPVIVDADIFSGFREHYNYFLENGSFAGTSSNKADSDQAFIELIGLVLRSPTVVTAAQSLIARVSDVLNGVEEVSDSSSTTAS